MSTDPASINYPIVEVVGLSGGDHKAPPSKGLQNANGQTDVRLESTTEPAKRPNTGIYTSSGKLDERSAQAQALLKAKGKKTGGCQS